MEETQDHEVPASGDLTQVPLVSILEHLTQSAATTTLVVNQGTTVKAIYIQNGEIVYATSTIKVDRLGETLLRHGTISQTAHKAATKQMHQTGKREGETLVEMGVLTPKGLFEGLKMQVEEIIISIFMWDKGEYQMADGALPIYITILPIHLGTLLPKALERMGTD